MGPSTFWFLLLLSVGYLSIRTRVDGVWTRYIQTPGRVSDPSSRVGSTGSDGSPPRGAPSVTIRRVGRMTGTEREWLENRVVGQDSGIVGQSVGRSDKE
jgi:hypothetical protein